MENVKNLNELVSSDIYDKISKRLMTQYRSVNQKNIMKDDIYQLINNYSNVVVSDCYKDAISDAFLKYRDLIEKPSNSLGSRLKFLITGKF